MDRPAAFARALQAQIEETFGEFGIDALYEDQMEAIVADCTDSQYDASWLEQRVRLRGNCLPLEGRE